MSSKCNLFVIWFLFILSTRQIQADYSNDFHFDGVQIFTTTAQNQHELNREFRRLKNAGISIVLFRCFKNPGDTPFAFKSEKVESGVYFESAINPTVSNILPIVVQTAHKNNMKCYAWITTRSSQWILGQHPQWQSHSFNFQTNTFENSSILDISNPNVLDHLSNTLKAVAKTNVDGILIQDDWISRQNDDLLGNFWTNFHKTTFQKQYLKLLFKKDGHSIKYLPLYYQWSRYKSQKLASTLQHLLSQVKSQYPDLKIAVNLYYETITKPSTGRAWLSQDLEDLLQFCPSIDYFAIMAYQQQMSRELKKCPDDIYRSLEKAYHILTADYLIPPEKLFWKIQVQDWRKGTIIPKPIILKFQKISQDSISIAVPYRTKFLSAFFMNDCAESH